MNVTKKGDKMGSYKVFDYKQRKPKESEKQKKTEQK